MKLIYSVISLIISAVIFFAFVDPLYIEVKQLKTDVATYKTALDNSTELQKTRDNLIEVYKNVKEEDKDRLTHFLPDTIGNIELILEIEKIANLHGMPIGDIKFDTKKLETQDKGDATTASATAGSPTTSVVVAETDPSSYLPYGIFPMEFTIEGRYDTFVSFLKDLEHNLRLVDIKAIYFMVPSSTTVDNGNANVYKYTVKVETYWLK